jgi:hypothetical protein
MVRSLSSVANFSSENPSPLPRELSVGKHQTHDETYGRPNWAANVGSEQLGRESFRYPKRDAQNEQSDQAPNNLLGPVRCHASHRLRSVLGSYRRQLAGRPKIRHESRR